MHLCKYTYFFVLLAFTTARSNDECHLLPSEVKEAILSYAPTVKMIMENAINGTHRSLTYKSLASFINKFPRRFSGSQILEDSIDYMIDISQQHGFSRVHGEEVVVPKWVRGLEYAALLQPVRRSLNIVGLGGSVGTPEGDILAEVVVVKSFDELRRKSSLVKGKIVVFNPDFKTYRTTRKYRSQGPAEAAKHGAIAALVRSVTPFSLHTAHTGSVHYTPGTPKIPAAAIAVEDARYLQKMQTEGKRMQLFLKMEGHFEKNGTSRNMVFEIRGSSPSEEFIIVSGHIDSWDIGDGAMDDGGGIFVTWEALRLLDNLSLRPRRTIRGVLFTAEEMGLIGAKAYAAKKHKDEISNLIFVMESDTGTFNPLGLEYNAGPMGSCIIKEIVKLFEPIEATRARKSPAVGSDITVWTKEGIPGASLDTDNSRYFWYHHTAADNMDIENSVELDKNTALWASAAYVIADLEFSFPRN